MRELPVPKSTEAPPRVPRGLKPCTKPPRLLLPPPPPPLPLKEEGDIGPSGGGVRRMAPLLTPTCGMGSGWCRARARVRAMRVSERVSVMGRGKRVEKMG